MGRARDIEAFARLLDGAPASSVPASVATLGRTVSALRGIPAPALPAGLAARGGVALLTKAGVAGTRIAATKAATTGGTRIAAHAATTGGTRIAATKASLIGILGAHLAPVVAGTAMLAVGVSGVAVGASRSLPGDPLYGVKRATESLQTATVSGNVALAERRLDLATTRLHEALALQQRGGTQARLASELHEWIADEAAALEVLTPLAATPTVRAKLAAFAAENASALTDFPAAVVAPAVAAVTTVKGLLTAKLPTAGGPALTLPPVTPSLPAVAASLLPSHSATKAPAHLPTTVASLPGVHVTPPSAPTLRPSAGLPTKLPTSVVPSAKLPIATLPSALPSALPIATLPTATLPSVLPTAVPSIPAVTTLLQNVLPRH